METWTHRFAETNGIRMHYVEQGEGFPLVLCHGIPELWYSWRFQIPALAAAGLRAIAPDLRGYGEPDKPTELQAYDIHHLTADIVGLLDALGLEWEYEKEGYRLSNGMPYLPDFWLPELECWLEIKGNAPTDQERDKAHLLADGTGYPVFVFVGLPSVGDPAKPTGWTWGASATTTSS